MRPFLASVMQGSSWPWLISRISNANGYNACNRNQMEAQQRQAAAAELNACGCSLQAINPPNTPRISKCWGDDPVSHVPRGIEFTHRWLRDPLTDKELTQRDVANALGVTDAVVSRFIRTGEPGLTVARLESLPRLKCMTEPDLLDKMPEEPEFREQRVPAEIGFANKFAGNPH
jgi:hypothetical protein